MGFGGLGRLTLGKLGSGGGTYTPLELIPSLIEAGMNHLWTADPAGLTFDVTETDEVTTAEDLIGDPIDRDATGVSTRRAHWVASSATFNGFPAFIWDNATVGGLLRLPADLVQNTNSLAFMCPVVQGTAIVNGVLFRADAGIDLTFDRLTVQLTTTGKISVKSRRLDGDARTDVSSPNSSFSGGVPFVLFAGINWANDEILIQVNNSTVYSNTSVAGWDGPTSDTASWASVVNFGASANETTAAVRASPAVGCWRNNWPTAAERSLAFRAMRDSFGPF